MRCKYKGFPALNKPMSREYSLYTSFFVVLSEKYYKHGIRQGIMNSYKTVFYREIRRFFK